MTAADSFPEELASRYQPVRPLGEGGMGVVWLATKRASGQAVAVKLMVRLDDPHLVQRTLRECELLAQLDHPAVLRYLDSGRLETGPYLVTEYLEGSSLEDLPVGSVDAESVMMQVAEGLEVVHGRGLLHRDVKPANLFLTKGGRAVLLDFGLALDADRTRLTATSSNLLGTPVFLAPELWRGREASPASDWYAWGMSAFYLLEGRLPMEPQEVLDWAVSGGEWKAPHLERSDPDLPLVRGLRACLAPDPDQRVQTLADLRAAMAPRVPRPARALATSSSSPAGGFRSGVHSVQGAPRSPLLGRLAAATVVALALGWGFFTGAPQPPKPPAPPSQGSDLPPAEARGGFPLEFASQLEMELLAARHHAITATGREIPVEQMAEEDRLALSSDPIHHRSSLEGLPELWRFLTWIAEGGDVQDLEPRLREDLLDVDGAYQAELGEPVLRAFLKLAPAEDPAPLVSGEWSQLKVGLRPGHEFRGAWTKAALRAALETVRFRAEYDEELYRSPQGPIRGGEVVAVGGLVGATDIDDYLTAVAIRPSTRTQARDWVLPGIVQFRLALVLARRALEAAEPDEELLGCVLAETASDMGGFFVAGHSTLPPAVRDGGPATRPSTWFVRAAAHRKAAVRLEAFDADSSAHRKALPEMWLRAMGPSSVEAPDLRWVRWRQGRAFWRLVRQAYKDDDPGWMRRAVETALPWLHETPNRFRDRGGADLGRYILRRPDGIGLAPEQRAALIRALEGVEGHAPFDEALAGLRERWGL